jgi:hypothetical protein
MTGAEFLVMALLAYVVVAPDGVSLAASRGLAGAVRAGVSGSSVSRPRGSSTSSSWWSRLSGGGGPQVVTDAPSRSRLGAMAGGWRQGVQDARQARADGRDTWSRASRVAGRAAGGARGAYADARARFGGRGRATDQDGHPVVAGDVVDDHAVADAAGQQASGFTDLTKDPAVANQATAPENAPHGASTTSASAGGIEKENEMKDITELESLDAVEAETRAASQMCADLDEALTAVKAWSAGLADRWAGTDWGTRDLDAAVSNVAEAAGSLGDAEALAAGLAQVQASVDKARGLGELAAEVGAQGDVGRFRAA